MSCDCPPVRGSTFGQLHARQLEIAVVIVYRADLPICGAGLGPLRVALDEAQHFKVRVGETLLRALVGPSGVLVRPCGLLTVTFPTPPDVLTVTFQTRPTIGAEL
jgi:hypothetical protein